MNVHELEGKRLLLTHPRLLNDVQLRGMVMKNFSGKRDWKVRVPNGPGIVLQDTPFNKKSIDKINEMFFKHNSLSKSSQTSETSETSETETDEEDSVIDDMLPNELPCLQGSNCEHIDIFVLRKMIVDLQNEITAMRQELSSANPA